MALALSSVAIAGGSLVFATSANASVKEVSCPTNGPTIHNWYGNDWCYAGYGTPPAGVDGIDISNAGYIFSNWNHGYSNYDCGSEDLSNAYNAGGGLYYYLRSTSCDGFVAGQDNWAYSVVIQSERLAPQ